MKTEKEISKKLERLRSGKFKIYIPSPIMRDSMRDGMIEALKWVLEEK